MQLPRSLVVASTNDHKIKEIKEILKGFPLELKSLSDFDEIPGIPETGQTYEENALSKARYVSERLKAPVLADDSGLEIKALNGEPGIYSNRFLGETTSYEIKNNHILDLMKNIPDSERQAKFVCAAAVAFPDGESVVVRGEVSGMVAGKPQGVGGFGYDPVFFLPEYGKTMAELSSEEKNKISHRAKAFLGLAKKLSSLFSPLR